MTTTTATTTSRRRHSAGDGLAMQSSKVQLKRRHALRRPTNTWMARRNSASSGVSSDKSDTGDTSGINDDIDNNEERRGGVFDKENNGRATTSATLSRESRSFSNGEYLGSSLELAPSLLSIYDNLAASSENDNDHDSVDFTTFSSNHHQHHNRRNHVASSGAPSASHSWVTSHADSQGFWVTDRDSRHRLWVRPPSHVTGSGSPARPVSLVMEPSRDIAGLDRDKVKKRPLSISSLSSVSSTSLPRLQHKRPNLAQDVTGDDNCSDLASHTSSDSNLMSDRLSLASDRVSLTSDPVSLTYYEPGAASSITSDLVSADGVSLTSSVDDDPCSSNSIAAMTTSTGSIAVGGHGRRGSQRLESSVDPEYLDTSSGGGNRRQTLGPPSPSSGRKSPVLTSGSRASSSNSSLSASSPGQQQSSETSPPEQQGSGNRKDSFDPNSSRTSLASDSSVDEAAKSTNRKQQQPPVVMKPLQTTIRPVVINLPESIRKPRGSSSSVDGELPLVCGDLNGSGSRRSSNSSTCSGPPSLVLVQPRSPTLFSHTSTPTTTTTTSQSDSTASSVAAGSPGSGGGGSASVLLRHSVSAPSPLKARGSVSASSPSASTLTSTGETVGTASASRGDNHSVSGPSGSLGVPLSPSSGSAPFSPSVQRSVSTGGLPLQASYPQPQPIQIQSLAQHSIVSPMSPTALARRRFLASHFDMPDEPYLEEAPSVYSDKPADASMDASETPVVCISNDKSEDSTSVISSGPQHSSTNCNNSTTTDSNNIDAFTSSRRSDLAVPSSLPLGNSSSPMSLSPLSGSPGSALHSPSGGGEEFLSGEDDEASTPRASADQLGASSPVSQGISSPSSPSSHRTNSSSLSTPHGGGESPTSTSPPSRGRTSTRKTDGSVGGGGGSVKGGSYVTYVQRVVTEIVDTERMYVDSLEAIIQGYLEPLKKLLGNSKAGREDLDCLFCNITDIYEFGKKFLADLEKCGMDPVKVAECFVKHNNGFVIYTDYCTHYPRAVEVLTRFMHDAELSQVCKECQVALGHGLPLGAYLLRPVQRILKYHLLLQNILKNFDKKRPGHATLEKAMGHMTAMAHHINEMKRRHEHAVRIQEVQSQLEDYSGEDLTRLGELVLEGSFRVYGAKASRQVFLFEKGILITKKKEGGMLTCKACVPCSNLMLVEVIPNEPLSFHIIPFDNPRAQHTLQARGMEQKRHWCQEIKRLLLESYKGRIPDNVKSLVMELGRNHDDDYVGKDTHDSPWKHQHTAPEYLEKRRYRRKSGGKTPDFGPLLKLPRPKRDQSAGKKSPKSGRKSDPKLNTSRERAESLPMMLADVDSASLPGIAVSPGLKSSNSFNRQTSSSSSSEKPAGKPTASTAAADGNNNNRNKDAGPESPDIPTAETPFKKLADDDINKSQRRAPSFKRAMRLQPLCSQDLADLDSIPMADDDNDDASSRMTGGDPQRSSRGEQRQVAKNGHYHHHRQVQMPKGRESYGSSGSNSPDSSDDSDRDERHKQKQHDKKTKQQHHLQPPKMTSMYSSMPSLHTLERKPAQKRRPGQTKSGAKTSKDVARSSENVSSAIADDRTEAASASSGTELLYGGNGRQYRRRWEGADDGMQKKVPALHDTYGRRSRENLLRRKGGTKGGVTGARLTDWGSVDKLTHGSLSDLSHLKDDPWVMKTSPISSPRFGDSPPTVCLTPPLNAPSRSVSVSQMPSASRDWNHSPVSGSGRPRNYSDVSAMDEAARRSGKENLDWVMYLNRNSDDHEMRERASSFNQTVSMRSKPSSDDLLSKALRDSNSSNVSKSSSLCQDTLKRYSLESTDDEKKKASSGEDSNVILATSPNVAVSSVVEARYGTKVAPSDQRESRSSLCTTLVTPGSDGDVEMADETNRRSSNPPLAQPEQYTHQAQESFTSCPVASPRSPRSPAKDVSRNIEILSPADQTPSSSSNNPQQHIPPALLPHDANTQVSAPAAAAVHSTSPLSSPTVPRLPSPKTKRPDQCFSQPHQADHPVHSPAPQPRRLHRPLSPESALSAEGERMVAEMEKYYQANTPRTPSASAFRFPSSPSSDEISSHVACASSTMPASQDVQGFHQAGGDNVDGCNTGRHHHLQPGHNGQDSSINRLSGVSSSSSNDGVYASTKHHLHIFPTGDVNTNRLSGVSSISTSSYESQNSNSSDSLVGTLKTKLSVLTNKLGGGKRSREEDLAHAHHNHHDEPCSPTDFQQRSTELQTVLREHALGSSNLGSRMAHTLPVGMEPLLSPSDSPKEQVLSSYEYSSKESSPEPQSRFSFPSAVTTKNQPETLPPCGPVQQSDSGICMYHVESADSRPRGLTKKASTLPANINSENFLAEGEAMDGDGCADDCSKQRRCSASSTASGDSYYERRLSVAFESSVFHDPRIFDEQNLQECEGQQPPPGECNKQNTPRRSIREVVQYIEEKFRPRHPKPVEVKRKEPSALIRQRLQSLRDNASYKRRFSNRSVSEDRTRTRDRTPDSPRISRPEQRCRSGSSNQFMHRVQADSCTLADTRDAEQRAMERGRERQAASRREVEMLASRERQMAVKRERGQASKRERELAAKTEMAATRDKAAARELNVVPAAGEADVAEGDGATEPERAKSEARSDDGGSSILSGMGSLDHLDQLSTDVDNLVIMRGWVRSLINKFQQKT